MKYLYSKVSSNIFQAGGGINRSMMEEGSIHFL